MRNGKGILYYKNGNIKYEGNYLNDKKDGKGKYIFEDGNYYIGHWKNDLKNGTGSEYDKNGNIIFKGEYINDIRKES